MCVSWAHNGATSSGKNGFYLSCMLYCCQWTDYLNWSMKSTAYISCSMYNGVYCGSYPRVYGLWWAKGLAHIGWVGIEIYETTGLCILGSWYTHHTDQLKMQCPFSWMPCCICFRSSYLGMWWLVKPGQTAIAVGNEGESTPNVFQTCTPSNRSGGVYRVDLCKTQFTIIEQIYCMPPPPPLRLVVVVVPKQSFSDKHLGTRKYQFRCVCLKFKISQFFKVVFLLNMHTKTYMYVLNACSKFPKTNCASNRFV